ncbi:unnamed protein product, partial [Callosobruchus maculatus]
MTIADVVASTGSMIVVSNRLPFVLIRDKDGKLKRRASAGGLVTAVAPVVINGNGLWVGWPGIHLEDPNEPIPESDPTDITPTAGLKSDKIDFVLTDAKALELMGEEEEFEHHRANRIRLRIQIVYTKLNYC